MLAFRWPLPTGYKEEGFVPSGRDGLIAWLHAAWLCLSEEKKKEREKEEKEEEEEEEEEISPFIVIMLSYVSRNIWEATFIHFIKYHDTYCKNSEWDDTL